MIRTQAVQPKVNGIAARAIAASGIPIDSIRVDGGTQSRALLQESVIEEYAAAIKDGATFPPVVIFYDGEDHWLADGFHRVRAYIAAGHERISADVRQGTRREAVLYSVGANEAHGLRRTNDDKRRAVLTLLNDAEWVKWSDREIARQCAVDHKTVTRLRADHLGKSPDTRTVKRNGSTYTMNTAAIGKPSDKEEQPAVEQTANKPIDLRRGNRFVLADGMSFDRAAREGMAREANGENADALAKEFQVGTDYYRKACDVVFLFDRGGYSEADQAVVSRALAVLVDESSPADAREIIEPVAVKVWGTGRLNGRPRPDREPSRLSQFEKSFGILIQTCLTTDEVDLPYLTADRAKIAAKEIRAARIALQRFADRIKGIHE